MQKIYCENTRLYGIISVIKKPFIKKERELTLGTDFAEPKNRNIWFKYPLHVMDKTDKVKKMLSRGDPKLNLKQFKDGSFKTNEDKLEKIEDAFNIVAMGSGSCDVKDIVEYLSGNGDKPDTIRRKLYRTIKEIESDFVIKDGVIFKGRKEGKK